MIDSHEEDVSCRLGRWIPQEARVVFVRRVGVCHGVVDARTSQEARVSWQIARPRADRYDVTHTSRLQENPAPNLARSDAHCRRKGRRYCTI